MTTTNSTREKLREMFESAIRLSRGGKDREAIELLSELTDSAEFREQAVKFRAAVRYYLGGLYLYYVDEPVPAEDHFRKATSLAPNAERASLGLFHALVAQRRPMEALDECARFLSRRDSAEYRRVLEEINEDVPDD